MNEIKQESVDAIMEEDVRPESATITNGNLAKRKSENSSDPSSKKEKMLYRLVIQIDKVRSKPVPRAGKNALVRETLMDNDTANEANDSDVNSSLKRERTEVSMSTEPDWNPCQQGCHLENVAFQGKCLFRCKNCNKYYATKKQDKVFECLICKEIFESAASLAKHAKGHLTCGVCGAECATTDDSDAHQKLHIGRPPSFPYKCHLCLEVFRMSEDVRPHLLKKHPASKWANSHKQEVLSQQKQQNADPPMLLLSSEDPDGNQVFRSVPCNVPFGNSEVLQNLVCTSKVSPSNAASELTIAPNSSSSTTRSSPDVLQAVKFMCRICSQELMTVGEIDEHTKSHMIPGAPPNVFRGYKCNVCSLIFVTERQLNEHVRDHLAKAKQCMICSKIFVNRGALRNHLKSQHDTVKA